MLNTPIKQVRIDRLSLKLTNILVTFFIVLFLSCFVAQGVNAEQILLTDNFTTDQSLNSSLWQTNGPYGSLLCNAIRSVIAVPSFALVNTDPSFSNSGMCINSVNNPYQMSSLETVSSFSTPITVQVQVAATQSGGTAFAMWIDNVDKHTIVGFSGVLNPNAPKYGIWSDHTGLFGVNLIASSPQLNTIYQLTISINAAGDNTLSVSSNGQTLGSVSEQSLGVGSLKIILAQYEIDQSSSGTGPNQAYWKSISITNPNSPVTPTDASLPTPNTSPTTSTVSPTPPQSTSSRETVTPTPSISSPLPSPSVSISPNPSQTKPTTIPDTAMPFQLEVLVVAVIAAFVFSIITVIIYRNKKERTKQVKNQLTQEVDNSRAKLHTRNLFLVPLVIAAFSTGLSNSIISLFATDIATTFFGSYTTVAVSAVSQLNTINMVAEFIAALVLSVLVVKFRHKRLFLAGTIFLTVSALGGYFAPTLQVFQFFFALEGVGSLIISIIAATIIADSLPAEKRAKAIGYLFSIGAAVTLIMIPLVGVITEMGGWRSGLIALVLPISLLVLVLSLFMLPSAPLKKDQSPKVNPYIEGFRQILKNRSAAACLIANLLTVAGTEVAIFALAFYRIEFSASRQLTVMIYELSIVLFLLAPLVSGWFVAKYGAKRVALLTTFLAACFTAIFFFVSNLWLAITLDMMHVWFAAMALPAFAILVLEQIPKYRGTLFSLNSLFNTLGKVLAPSIGGTLLIFSSGIYGAVGVALGGMTIMGCIIIFFLVNNSKQN
jgi:MFS family permease